MTARTWGRLAFVLLMAAIVQVGILDRMDVHNAHPDVFLILVVMLGVMGGAQRGAVLAFAAGLVADLLVSTPFGLSCLCYVLLAFAAGSFASLWGARLLNGWRVVIGAVGGVVGALLYAGLLALLDQPGVPPGQVLVVCLVVAVSNAILAVPAALTLSWVLRTSVSGRDLAGVVGGSAR